MSVIKVDIDKINIQNSNIQSFLDDVSRLTSDTDGALDKIKTSWSGKKSKVILENIDKIKNIHITLIARLEENKMYIKGVADNLKAASEANVEPNVLPVIEASPTITLNTGPTSFSEFDNNMLDKLISIEKSGQNSYDSFDLEASLKSYNTSPNSSVLSKQDPNYLQNSSNSLDNMQKKLISSGLWGTDSAARILSIWMLQTNFKIPTTASTKTDGLGNQRGIGIGKNWNSTGVDCTNFAYWFNVNSGLMKEGMVLDNPATNNVAGTQPLRGDSGVPSGNFKTGDIVARDGHVGVYLYSDDNYIFTFETARRGSENNHGTMLSAVYLESTNDSLPSSNYGPTYQRNYWTHVAPSENINLYNPKTSFNPDNVLLKPNTGELTAREQALNLFKKSGAK